MEREDHVDIEIDNLGVYGEGVGRKEGLIYFVEGALPGERVKIAVTEKRSSFARGELLSILRESKERVTPPCPLFDRCGGCQIMHLAYEKQLYYKQRRVQEALTRIGGLQSDLVAPCLPSPSPLAYRNKIQLPLDSSGRLGLYARHSHTIIPVDKCLIHCDLGEEVFHVVSRLLKAMPQPSLRHLLIKTATHTNEALVVLITKTKEPLKTFAEAVAKEAPSVKGVVQRYEPRETNAILGSELCTLVGQGWIEEELSGLRFKISPTSFFQVNPAQAEVLYEKALAEAELTGAERVLDAYCGVGTLSLLFAKRAREVTGIETVGEAIADAKENAQRNGIDNAIFLTGKAEEKIKEVKGIDVALLNPPRKGCEKSLLLSLAAKKPGRIIYISCDPATLARDLKILVEKGYTLKGVQPVDMFPQTMHVESIATLVRS